MFEFVSKDFHNDFINYNKEVLNNLIVKYHDLDKDISNIYNELIIYRNYLDIYLLTSKLKSLDYVKINNKGFSVKPNTITLINNTVEEKLFVTNYNYMLVLLDKQYKISKLIDRHSLLQRIPYIVFKVILHAINFEIAGYILRGNIFKYPKIGEVYIARVPYDNTKPDWGRSYEFKNYLEEQGIATKDSNNENGKAWLVDNGLDRDYFILLKWNKGLSQLRNKEPYKLNASIFGNIYSKVLKKVFTIDELVNLDTTGLFDKIIHIYRYHDKYAVSNFPFVNTTPKH